MPDVSTNLIFFAGFRGAARGVAQSPAGPLQQKFNFGPIDIAPLGAIIHMHFRQYSV
jgi:hypothetical protein